MSDLSICDECGADRVYIRSGAVCPGGHGKIIACTPEQFRTDYRMSHRHVKTKCPVATRFAFSWHDAAGCRQLHNDEVKKGTTLLYRIAGQPGLWVRALKGKPGAIAAALAGREIIRYYKRAPEIEAELSTKNVQEIEP